MGHRRKPIRILDDMKDLFPYQYTGAKWLLNKKFALLGDEMGLGKTVQVLHAADLLSCNQIVICCPAISRFHWEEHALEWSLNLKIKPILNTKTDFEMGESIAVSYDLIPHYFQKLIQMKPDILVLEESHYLKSLDAHRSKFILGKEGLIHNAKRTWEISGTPAPNHAGELWARLYVFGVTKLTYDQFIKRYCVTVWDNKFHKLQIKGTKKEMIPELKQILSGYMLRRMKVDVLKDLPPLLPFKYIYLPPGEVDFDMHKSTIEYSWPTDNRHEYFEKVKAQERLIESTLDTIGVGADGLKALEAVSHSVPLMRQYCGLQLVEPVLDLVCKELERKAYEKIILFAVHRDVIENLRRDFVQRGVDCVTLYGATPPDQRQKNIQRFQTNKKCKVFIGNIQACCTTISLTAAHNILFVESDWVPGNNAQAIMRAHRIGQTLPVFVRFAAIKNSIHERIIHTLKRKTEELTLLFG